MEEGFYLGKGFDLMYCVTKIQNGYELLCVESKNTHVFAGDALDKSIKNFLNNHFYIHCLFG